MEDADFSDEFCRFLQANVPTVEAAEQMLQRYRQEGLAAFAAPVAAHLETLAAAYEQRPVTLIRIIYALRAGKIHSFADAFRLRKR